MHAAPALVAAALLALAVVPSQAERTPPRPAPLAGAHTAEARVIVKFRAGAATLRAHALSATSSAEAAARASAERATSLGNRHGLLLHAGAAVGERVQVVRADAAHGLSAQALAARLAADPEVEYAEPDRRVRRVAVPNDPFFTAVAGGQGPAAGQWYLRAPAGDVQSAINAVTAWDLHTGNPSVVVAVLDTGVRLNHPDLAGKLVGGHDFVNDSRISNDGNGRDADPSDPGDFLTQAEINADTNFWDGCEASGSSWHGTQVSGIVAAATGNGVGMAGSGRHVRVLPVRVLGKCFGYTSDIAAAIRWAAGEAVPGVPANASPAKVINLSLGSAGACSQAEADAVAAANARGAVVIAAAGNTAGRSAGSPANCAGAIGVAAVRHIGTKVGFSDVGPQLAIAAPGGNCVNESGPCLYPILSTTDSGQQGPVAAAFSDSFDFAVGTSFSSPLVAGTAGLLYSVRPGITPAQVRTALQSTARPFPASGAPPDPFTGAIVACQAPGNFDQLQCYCTTATCGAGMLDANAALRSVLGASPALQPAVSAQPAAPAAGQTVTLSATGSLVPAGRAIASRRWAIVEPGGIATAFTGASDQDSAALVPSAAGRFTVQLTLTDDRGLATSVDFPLAVAAAPVAPPQPPPPPSPGGGGGGGGAMSWAWLLALAGAAVALRRSRPR
jgi:serine protease